MGYRGGGGGPQIQMVVPFTKTVKYLVIANVAIWLVLQVIVEGMFLDTPWFTTHFGFVPIQVLKNFKIWQFVSYMFLHSTSPFHIVFNMLLLWWLGSELEQNWGARFFALYYFVCGIGAAVVYFIGTVIYLAVTGKMSPLVIPVIGASGAVFGLMLAYGIIFGEKVIYFMMIFPMKAKFFVLILGAIEVIMLVNHGVGGSNVANLAHIGGIVAGFIFLMTWTRYQGFSKKRRTKKHGRSLRLVVNNDSGEPKDPDDGPRYWN